MSLQRVEQAELEKCKKTLKECSKDDFGNPVTEYEYEAYRFDDISELEASRYRRGRKTCSADALYIKNDREIFLFEFKNTRKSHVPWRSIYDKAHDSLFTLQVTLFPELSLLECAERINYFVIYNNNCIEEKENASVSFERFRASLKTWANVTEEYPVLWGLKIYEGTFYNRVMTLDIADFEREFLPLIYP